jgi:hypothetical protein
MTVEYAEDKVGGFKLFRRPVPREGLLQLAPGQSQEGYGSKITTDFVLQFYGEAKKHRVYCTCWSNAGSLWITHERRRLYLRTHFQSEVIEEE